MCSFSVDIPWETHRFASLILLNALTPQQTRVLQYCLLVFAIPQKYIDTLCMIPQKSIKFNRSMIVNICFIVHIASLKPNQKKKNTFNV